MGSHVATILGALRNYVFKDKDIEELAKLRAGICGTCENYSNVGYQSCKICKCSIPLKIRAINKKREHECPIGKWNELSNLTENIIKKLYAN